MVLSALSSTPSVESLLVSVKVALSFVTSAWVSLSVKTAMPPFSEVVALNAVIRKP